jgi:transcriptional regulator with XRE-family HTH domain
MNEFWQQTGQRLRLIEKALTLNGAKIARMTENRISASRWSEYCKGSRLITVEAALALHEQTGATLDFIYRGDRSGLPQRLVEAINKLPA